MANFNKVILIGRCTRDPEVRTFANGGKVAKIGFAASPARKKNPQTGQYEDEPMFVDVEVFNRGEKGTLANIVEQYCRKGSMLCIEGKLHLDSWDDKASGQKRQKHKIVADSIQLLDKKGDSPAKPASPLDGYDHPDDPPASGGSSGAESEIPF